MTARALTIAGSDCSGGAGIQADIKTFTVFGVYGTSVITAVTAQDTRTVHHVVPLAPETVRAQLEAVLGDIGADAAKTGMLPTAAVVMEVVRAARDHSIERLVVDPVMKAGSGAALIDAGAVEALRRELIPLAMLVTPNAREAEALTGLSIRTVGDQRRAARALIAGGAKAVLLKGGHLEGDEAVDVFDDGDAVRELRAPRIPARDAHGTGCQMSAAIAANLALSRPLWDSIATAKRFITAAIEHRLAIGHGHPPANPLAWLDKRRTEEE